MWSLWRPSVSVSSIDFQICAKTNKYDFSSAFFPTRPEWRLWWWTLTAPPSRTSKPAALSLSCPESSGPLNSSYQLLLRCKNVICIFLLFYYVNEWINKYIEDYKFHLLPFFSNTFFPVDFTHASMYSSDTVMTVMGVNMSICCR